MCLNAYTRMVPIIALLSDWRNTWRPTRRNTESPGSRAQREVEASPATEIQIPGRLRQALWKVERNARERCWMRCWGEMLRDVESQMLRAKWQNQSLNATGSWCLLGWVIFHVFFLQLSTWNPGWVFRECIKFIVKELKHQCIKMY